MTKRKQLCLGAAIATMALASQSTQAITLDINSNAVIPGFNGQLQFDVSDDSFSFIPAVGSPYSFNVEAGPAVFGHITGDFIIQPFAANPGGIESATVVSSNGALVINDATGVLTADVNFGDIFTLGTAGGINAGGSINLTSLNYTGINPFLAALAGDPAGSVSIQFGFNPAISLSELTGGNPITGQTVFETTFTGDLTNAEIPDVVPEGGATLLLMGAALSGLALARRKKA